MNFELLNTVQNSCPAMQLSAFKYGPVTIDLPVRDFRIGLSPRWGICPAHNYSHEQSFSTVQTSHVQHTCPSLSTWNLHVLLTHVSCSNITTFTNTLLCQTVYPHTWKWISDFLNWKYFIRVSVSFTNTKNRRILKKGTMTEYFEIRHSTRELDVNSKFRCFE
jgi:hypothetical protein